MNTELAISAPVGTMVYSEDKIDLIKRTVCQGASNDELTLFLHQCQRTGLDALSRQIYAVFRNAKEGDKWVKKMSIQVSIDGFRLIAERSKEYEGQTEAFWCGEDGVWKDVWLSKEPPAAAKVGVYRKGFRDAVFAVAKFDSYKQSGKDKQTGREYLTGLWVKMPEVMIAKCAESLALRKAFPQELSGLYTSDEMGQAKDTEIEAREEKREQEARRASEKPVEFQARLTRRNEQGVLTAEIVDEPVESGFHLQMYDWLQQAGILREDFTMFLRGQALLSPVKQLAQLTNEEVDALLADWSKIEGKFIGWKKLQTKK